MTDRTGQLRIVCRGSRAT